MKHHGNPHKKATTTTKEAIVPNPSVYGQPITVTATVTINPPGGGAPTGSVQFQLDGTNFGSPVPVNAQGQASVVMSNLAVGSHSIVAVYSGDNNDNGSTSQPVTQQVNKANTTVALTVA